MPKNTLGETFPDLNYYTSQEPWRRTRRLAHEVLCSIGTEYTPTPPAVRKASAQWTDPDSGIGLRLSEEQSPSHAHYSLHVAPHAHVNPTTDTELRYRFSSAHPRIKYAPRADEELTSLFGQELQHHQLALERLLLTGLTHLDSQETTALVQQRRIDDAFWNQAASAVLITAESPQREAGEAARPKRRHHLAPALGHLSIASALDHPIEQSAIEELAHDIARGHLHTASPQLPGAAPLTVRDIRTARRFITSYLVLHGCLPSSEHHTPPTNKNDDFRAQ